MAEVFQVKLIRAKKLNVEAFAKEIQSALEDEGRDVVKEYEKTTKTWRRKPKFEVVVDTSGGEAAVLVGTDDEVYGYVDQGTRPHPIRARRYPTLQYRKGGFVPKTTPGVIGSKAGSRATGPIRRPKEVMHPGTKAREFSQTIQSRRKSPFTRRMVKAMQDAGKKAF